jgi:hypothetical protein
MCESTESQALLPELDEGVKQILWSPESAAVKVNRPDDAPFCETTRWSLSKISCAFETYVRRSGQIRWRGIEAGPELVICRDGYTYVNRYKDVQPTVFAPGSLPLIILLRGIVAHDYRVLRKLLEETFWCLAINKKVEGLDRGEDGVESQQRDYRPHDRYVVVCAQDAG